MKLREIARRVWSWIKGSGYTPNDLAIVVASDIRIAIVKALAEDNEEK